MKFSIFQDSAVNRNARYSLRRRGRVRHLNRLSIVCSIMCVTFAGCATTRGRFVLGALSGGAVAAPIAAVLSPNKESLLFNALVFGLGGALAGAFTGVLSLPEFHTDSSPSATTLRAREAAHAIRPEDATYLEGRVIPPVIESFQQEGLLSEDGVLHEPHRAFRIARPAELVPAPSAPKRPSFSPSKQTSEKIGRTE